MPSRERIDAYRGRRPDSQLSDDMIAWELDTAPDCIGDVPPEFKEELARLADEDDDRPPPRALVSTRAPLSLYDFASSPHGGKWKPLPDHGGEPTISPRVHIDHSIVGSGAGAWGYFANSTSLESTNIVLKSGYFWQCMSRQEQADANFHANGFAISTETEDNGHPDTDPLTPEQIDTWVWLALQDINDFGIPKRICAAWDGSGVGYHSMWGAPSQWTPAVGKTCPGTVRIRQWRDIVVPRILGTLQEGDDMPLSDTDLDKIVEAVREALTTPPGTYNSGSVMSKIVDIQGGVDRIEPLTLAMKARVEAIESDVDVLVERTEPPA